MEKQKNGAREVEMGLNVNSQKNMQNAEASLAEELQKWTKEKLVQQVIQMNQQLFNQDNYLKRLRMQLNEMQDFISNKRIEYLFKVVETAQKNTASEYACFAKEFVEECISEIQESLTIPEKDETDGNSKED